MTLSSLLEPFVAAAAAHRNVPFVVSPIEATTIGSWVEPWRERGLLYARGVRSLYRAARAKDEFASGPDPAESTRRTSVPIRACQRLP